MLSEEEKKAIEWIKCQKGIYYKTIVDLIEKQEKELEKKDAVIDKMAEQLEKEIEWHYSEFDNYTKQDFIKHFTNLVEKENK